MSEWTPELIAKAEAHLKEKLRQRDLPECGFDLTWGHLCQEKVATKGTLCPEHEALKCVCGRKAIQLCSYATGLAVCGHPICGECEVHWRGSRVH